MDDAVLEAGLNALRRRLGELLLHPQNSLADRLVSGAQDARGQSRPQYRTEAQARLLHRFGAMDELNEVARMEIQPGWQVYTADDDALGEVDAVGDTSFTVTGMGATGGVLEVAFGDVESADDGRVSLMLSRDEIQPEVDAT